MIKANWPKKWITWYVNGTTFISVPFTWLLPPLKYQLKRSFKFNKVVVGGPAIKAMPDYIGEIPGVEINTGEIPGVLQRFEPLATKTTIGCVRKCKFCLVSKVEGSFTQLDDWPNLPIICDNNILASSTKHFQSVIDRLVDKWGWADFNGGIDVRLLNKYHVKQFSKFKDIILRIALDDMSYYKKWLKAVSLFKESTIKRNAVRSYALIGFNTGPKEAWERCTFIEKQGVMPIPMWFLSKNAMGKNILTDEQKRLGWTKFERDRIMLWFYNRTKIKKGLGLKWPEKDKDKRIVKKKNKQLERGKKGLF